MPIVRILSQMWRAVCPNIMHGCSAVMTGRWWASLLTCSRFFFIHSFILYIFYIMLGCKLVTHSNHFRDCWRHLALHAYFLSSKISSMTGRTRRRILLTSVLKVHLLLGLHCLGSIMMQQMSRHSLFLVHVCIYFSMWHILIELQSVLDPTTKDVYIKHYFALKYQGPAMENIHDIVSAFILTSGYHWILSVSWVS